jgi:hypothetical protein
MKELNVVQMEQINGGEVNGWCFAAGLAGALAIGTGGLGLIVYGPSAGALLAMCFN